MEQSGNHEEMPTDKFRDVSYIFILNVRQFIYFLRQLSVTLNSKNKATNLAWIKAKNLNFKSTTELITFVKLANAVQSIIVAWYTQEHYWLPVDWGIRLSLGAIKVLLELY